MIAAALCVPGDLDSPTGGYRYDRELLARLPGHGVAATHLRLPDGYPNPSPEDTAETARLLGAVDPGAALLIDGLALGAMPPTLVESLPHPVVALVHHPLGLEAGLAPERAAFLVANERAVLALAHGVVVTSAATARTLARDFGVAADRIAVAEPGTDRAERAPRRGPPFRLLAVGAVSPRKAYDALVRALAPLATLDWRLTIAGSLTLSPDAVSALRAAVEAAELPGRVALIGTASDADLTRLYAEADVVVAASLYEGYGMALAEALARGLPVVASSGGAAAETLPDAAALKVPPGDGAALTGALRRVMTDAALRERMAAAAWAAAERLPRWDDTAARVAAAIAAASRRHP